MSELNLSYNEIMFKIPFNHLIAIMTSLSVEYEKINRNLTNGDFNKNSNKIEKKPEIVKFKNTELYVLP